MKIKKNGATYKEGHNKVKWRVDGVHNSSKRKDDEKQNTCTNNKITFKRRSQNTYIIEWKEK